jgi:hypothetical protein
MRGWVVTNLGNKNAGQKGDVIISWFKPLDATLDDPADNDDQLYFMVVNGLTGPDGTAADYRQEIKINFLNTPVTSSIQRLNADTGQVDVLALPVVSTRRQLTIQLDGGEGALFKFNAGTPFVGFPTADFNGNAAVEGGDFLAWQRGFGTASGASRAQGDGNLDFAVNGADLALWQTNFGPAAASALAALPEPSARWLASFASTVLLARRGHADRR